MPADGMEEVHWSTFGMSFKSNINFQLMPT